MHLPQLFSTASLLLNQVELVMKPVKPIGLLRRVRESWIQREATEMTAA